MVVPIIKKILEYRKSGRVLDVGTGLGHHSVFLAENGFQVMAVDTKEELVVALAQTAKKKDLTLEAKVGDVRDLTSFGSDWDIVVCTFVLHFLQDEEVEKAVRDLKAMTKSGGLNVVGVHTTQDSDAERARKLHLFEPNELKERYSDWEVLHYWQGLGKPFASRQTGEMLAKYRADLIAQKP